MTDYSEKETGVTVRSVARESPFYRAGMRRGDRIISINGESVENELDFLFSASGDRLRVRALRSGQPFFLEVERCEGGPTGVALVEKPIRRCTNRCIFCFIDQMPRGLRHSLYVKDEDVRLSLLNGNYVTMSAFLEDDLEHIIRLGLSPLYVSVHTTDTDLRRRMLGNRKAPPIMEQLVFLARYGIRFHTQIVVCPTYNDGKALERSVGDLLTLGDSLRSVAVVPVGLTRFRKAALPAVDHRVAVNVCRSINRLSDRALRRDGFRKVFLADEFFIKAKAPIPEATYYEDFPQIENGVGLIRQLIDSWQNVKVGLCRRKGRRSGRFRKRNIMVTSIMAYPFLAAIIDEMKELQPNHAIKVVPVVNRFFGETVTVAGLLTASDIVRQIKTALKSTPAEELIVPAVLVNHAGFTLDGYSPARIGREVGLPVRVVNSIGELVD